MFFLRLKKKTHTRNYSTIIKPKKKKNQHYCYLKWLLRGLFVCNTWDCEKITKSVVNFFASLFTDFVRELLTIIQN